MFPFDVMKPQFQLSNDEVESKPPASISSRDDFISLMKLCISLIPIRILLSHIFFSVREIFSLQKCKIKMDACRRSR